MNLIISNSSEIPIYEQIKYQIKSQIRDNTLRENDLLPSIRSLAKDIRVSVMTVKKAYDELEMEGYISTIHGKGSFILGKNMSNNKEEALTKLETDVGSIVDFAKKNNIRKEDIIHLVNYLYEEDSNGKEN